jgi:TolB-like protein/DNA-binding winged helix-turn-helix (wHTH) protein/Tfp pilus assembly protein PilF
MSANTSRSSTTHRTYSFGEFTLDLDRGALLRADADIKLRPKSFEVLSYLIEREGLLVTKDDLFSALWGSTAVTEGAITQCLSDIRKAIDDQSQEKIRTVPGRGYIFDLPVTASDGSSRTKFASSWPRWYSGVALVLILVVAAAWWGFGNRAVKVPAPLSIAVLPFLDMSPGQDQAYFADGISEELLNLLAHIPGLNVIARTSSFSFKGQNADIATIAERLKVTHVLEGSVRKSANRIRITAQLVDASTSEHLWSETYNRELDDIFAVQDEISAAIVTAMKEHLGLQVEAPPRVIAATNTEAHDAYLRGRYLVVQRTTATIEGAVREFEKVVSLDPEYALAHAELAQATLLLGTYTDLTITELVARAAPHVERAMALNPTLAEAHAATGFLLWQQRNLEEALTHFGHATQINPNYAIVYLWTGNLLAGSLGRYAEGFAAVETALRLDPLSLPAMQSYVQGLISRNRLAEAERELEKLASTHPVFYALMRGVLTSLGGKWANAALANLDVIRIDPKWVLTRNDLALHFAILGLEKEALAISEDPNPGVLSLLGKHGDAVTVAEARFDEDPISLKAHHDLGLALAGAGDYARARPILEETWQRIGGRITGGSYSEIESTAALIAIRRDAGEEAEVGALVAAIRDDVHRLREAGIIRATLYSSVDYEEGLAAYLADERKKALALIAKAVEDGWFIPQREAYLQTLYDDSDFAPIRARQEARQTSERQKFLNVVCNDNPYAAGRELTYFNVRFWP